MILCWIRRETECEVTLNFKRKESSANKLIASDKRILVMPENENEK